MFAELEKSPSSHLDFHATLTALFDLESVPNEGLDLSGILKGRDRDVRERLFAEYHPRSDTRVYNQTVITDRWRFTFYPNEPAWGELFDLESDPWEHCNLFAEQHVQTTVEQMRDMLQSRLPAAPQAGAPVLGAY